MSELPIPYALALVGIEAALVGAYVLLPGQAAFDLDVSHTLWTWLSSVQLAGIASAFLLAHRAEQGRVGAPPPLAWCWLLLAFGFFCLSADEVLSIHEHVARTIALALLPPSMPLRDILPWQIVLAPAVFLAFAALAAMTTSRLASLPSLMRLVLTALVLLTVAFVADRAARPYFTSLGAPRAAVVLKELPQLLAETCLLLAFGAYAALRFERDVPIAPVRGRIVVAATGGLVAVVVATLAAVTALRPAYFYSRMAEDFSDAHNHDGAVAAYDLALRSAPLNSNIWHALGLSALRARSYARAHEAFRRESELRPDEPKAYGFMGIVAFLQGDLDGAQTAFEKAIALDPAYARAHRNLGWVYERRGDERRAEEHYRLALGSDDGMADVHRYLGNLLARTGRPVEALAHWRESLALDPNQQDSALLTQRIAVP